MRRIARYGSSLCICIGGILSLTTAGAPNVAAADNYTVMVVPALGNFGSYGTGLNDRGEVVGASRLADNNQSVVIHAFLWDGRIIQDLTGPGWTYSWPWDINNRGEVVGMFNLPDGGGSFLWDDGNIQDLGTTNSSGKAINERGSVVGTAIPPSGIGYQAFIWRNGVMQPLQSPPNSYTSANDINNAGDIVGSFQSLPGPMPMEAAIWLKGQFYNLGVLGEADAINERGQVILNQAFIWQNGILQALPQLPGSSGSARVYSINDAGQIVGVNNVCGTNLCSLRPVLWEGGNPIDLSAFIPAEFQPLEPGPMKINNRGQILITTGSKFSGMTFLLTPR